MRRMSNFSAEFLVQLQASGGRLVAVQVRLGDALVYLYDEFDAPAAIAGQKTRSLVCNL